MKIPFLPFNLREGTFRLSRRKGLVGFQLGLILEDNNPAMVHFKSWSLELNILFIHWQAGYNAQVDNYLPMTRISY